MSVDLEALRASAIAVGEEPLRLWDAYLNRHVMIPADQLLALIAVLDNVRDLVMNTDGYWLTGDDFDGLAGCIQEVVVPLYPNITDGPE